MPQPVDKLLVVVDLDTAINLADMIAQRFGADAERLTQR